MLTVERVREAIAYDPETGVCRWRIAISKRAPGTEVGTPHSHGYVSAALDRHRDLLHRLIWYRQTGEWPPAEVDHKDGNKSNNSWSNLRLASSSQNKANVSKRVDNTSGHRGVVKIGPERFVARLCVRGVRLHLGRFKSVQEAAAAYNAAAKAHFGEFVRAGDVC